MKNPSSQSETIPANSAYLIVNSQVFSLDKELTNIGRKLDNDIVIHDTRVSRNHAQLREVEGHFVILDLNSTGGTFVNDQKITKTVLYSGDTLSLSGVPAKFVQDAPRMITSAMDRTGPLPQLEFEEPPTQMLPNPKDFDKPT
jgi:pSer/pThr/pTyr-binding forkhead associated (FHA) protein